MVLVYLISLLSLASLSLCVQLVYGYALWINLKNFIKTSTNDGGAGEWISFYFLGQWSLIISQIIFFVILLVIAKAEEFNWNVITFHVISLFSRKERFFSQTRQNWTRQQRTFWCDFDVEFSSSYLVLWSRNLGLEKSWKCVKTLQFSFIKYPRALFVSPAGKQKKNFCRLTMIEVYIW